MSRSPLAWPPFVTDPTLPMAQLARGLGDSQAWTAERLQAGQRAQLGALARWAATSSPFYRDHARWKGPLQKVSAASDADFAERWRALPILSKADLRAQGARFHVPRLPATEMPVDDLHTSGSTGVPVHIRRNATARRMWHALTLRDAYWNGRDFQARLGIARTLSATRRAPDGEVHPSWGPPFAPLHATGPRAVIHVGLPLHVLDAWLDRHLPQVLLTYPSVLAELVRQRATRGAPAGLREVSLVSERVADTLVHQLRQDWNVRVTQIYSAIDAGYLALQCDQGRLHVQSEAVHVEVLRDDGGPCEVGEAGRVVVTPLHLLATPLLRYALGDYAVLGPACPCGREHPVLERVLGRERNLLQRPDGSVGWPSALGTVRKVGAVLQAQYVQTHLDRIELRVKVERDLTGPERDTLTTIVREILAYPFEVDVRQVDEIERGAGDKFEDFQSRLEPPPLTPPGAR